MDDNLRKLERAAESGDFEAMARLTAYRVKAGILSRDRVILAAKMGNQIARILEEDVYDPLIFRTILIEEGIRLLLAEDRKDAMQLKRTLNIVGPLAYDNLERELRRRRALPDSPGEALAETYEREINWQLEVMSAILLRLPEV